MLCQTQNTQTHATNNKITNQITNPNGGIMEIAGHMAALETHTLTDIAAAQTTPLSDRRDTQGAIVGRWARVATQQLELMYAFARQCRFLWFGFATH